MLRKDANLLVAAERARERAAYRVEALRAASRVVAPLGLKVGVPGALLEARTPFTVEEATVLVANYFTKYLESGDRDG